MSRTVPMNVTTAPTCGWLARKAATSVERSKSSVWMRIVTGLSSGDGREKGDFAALADRRVGARHHLVVRHTQCAALGQRFRPYAAALTQIRPHCADGGHFRRDRNGFLAGSERFAHAGKKTELDLHQ